MTVVSREGEQCHGRGIGAPASSAVGVHSLSGAGAAAAAGAAEPTSIFAGAGNTTGEAASSGGGASALSPGEVLLSDGAFKEKYFASFKLATDAQTCVVTIRSGDGSRTKGRFNPGHTVGDLHGFIQATGMLSAGGGCSRYKLLAGFPPRPLADPAATLSAAGAADSLVTLRAS